MYPNDPNCQIENGGGKMQWRTWANLVTSFGFIGVGVYVWAYLNWKTDLVLPVLILTALTDGLDGYLARKLNQRTKLGWILDPIRDKAIIFSVIGNIIFVYGYPIIQSIGILLVFEAATFTLNISRGLPQPIHVLGKARVFAHYFVSSLIILFTYYDFTLTPREVESLIFVMAGFSFLAFIGYLFFPAKKIPHA